jgi:hypothetical protein
MIRKICGELEYHLDVAPAFDCSGGPSPAAISDTEAAAVMTGFVASSVVDVI